MAIRNKSDVPRLRFTFNIVACERLWSVDLGRLTRVGEKGESMDVVLGWLLFGLMIGLLGACIFRRASSTALPYDDDERPFEERFPPLSDQEFVELCGPGTNREVALKVRRIISEQLGVEYQQLHPAMRFVEDLGAD